MNHYVAMLIREDENNGLHILTTTAYQELLHQQPGLCHENWGDFYSDVPAENLAARIYQAMDIEMSGKKMNSDAVIVDALPAAVDPQADYIIQQPQGVRLYSPSLHKESSPQAGLEYGITISLAYELWGLTILESLFSKAQQGSLQKNHAELEKMVNATLSELDSLLGKADVLVTAQSKRTN